MNISGQTKKGHKYEVFTTEDEIIYLDEFGDSLTWDDTTENVKLIENMIKVI